MSSDGIKRSVRSNLHDRAKGDAPSIGHVARMPGTGLPRTKEGRKWYRKHDDDKSSGRGARRRRWAVIGWRILLPTAAVLLLGGILWLWLQPKTDAGSVRGHSKFPSPSQIEALGLVKKALAVRQPGEVWKYFRMGSSRPEQVVEFLERLETMEGKISGYGWLSSVDVNRLSVDGVLVKFESGDTPTPRSRLALLTPDANGVWRVDFDALARTVTPAWSEILEKHPEFALVRVYATDDSYYNGPFRDDTEWICYGMASPDFEGILSGYCRVGSPQAAAMRRVFSKEAKLNRVTLELRRVEGASARQFRISRVLAEDWVLDEIPLDERF